MEENKDVKVLTPEEYKQKRAEYLEAKKVYQAQAKERKENREKQSKMRDSFLSEEKEVIDEIQTLIFAYRKLGKQAKWEFEILKKVEAIIDKVKPSEPGVVDSGTNTNPAPE